MPLGQDVMPPVTGGACWCQGFPLGHRFGMRSLQKLTYLIGMTTGITVGRTKFLGVGQTFGVLMTIGTSEVLVHAGNQAIAGDI